jgi:riboflavin synthase
MFTGLIQGTGTVAAVTHTPAGDGARLTFTAPWLAADARVGDSVAVNGCCLTVTERTGTDVSVHAVAETLRRTTLGGLRAGERVNLERPLALGDRLDGHIVQGHVDGTGMVAARDTDGDNTLLRVSLDAGLARYVAAKGSVAVDGVSLTVVVAAADHCTVALIPHTLAVTTLSDRHPGDRVNLEVDVLAKYVERLLAPELRPPAAAAAPDDPQNEVAASKEGTA